MVIVGVTHSAWIPILGDHYDGIGVVVGKGVIDDCPIGGDVGGCGCVDETYTWDIVC